MGQPGPGPPGWPLALYFSVGRAVKRHDKMTLSFWANPLGLHAWAGPPSLQAGPFLKNK